MKKRKLLISTQKIQPININYFDDKRIKSISKTGSSESESIEQQLLDNIQKEQFFDMAHCFKLNFSIIFLKPLTLREKHKLNIFLRTMKDRYNLKIMDSLIYIEERYLKFIQLLKYLDQENQYILKTEAETFNPKYKIDKNLLKDFLEFEKN